MSASFARLATVSAETLRNPPAVGGKIGAPASNLTALKILALMPVSPEIAQLYRLNSPREAYVTYTQGSPDVLEGDVLVIGAASYRIRGVGPWLTDRNFLEIIVEQIKGS